MILEFQLFKAKVHILILSHSTDTWHKNLEGQDEEEEKKKDISSNSS